MGRKEKKGLPKIRLQCLAIKAKLLLILEQNSLGYRGNTGFFKYIKNAICQYG